MSPLDLHIKQINFELFNIKKYSSAIGRANCLKYCGTSWISPELQMKTWGKAQKWTWHPWEIILCTKNYCVHALLEEEFDNLISLSFLLPSIRCSCFLLAEALSSISRSKFLTFLGHSVAIGFDFKDIWPKHETRMVWATQWAFMVIGLTALPLGVRNTHL